MKRYPVKLMPIAKAALWGGRRLCEQYGICSDCESIAEAWILSCREGNENLISNGEASGMTLPEYLAAIGELPNGAEFPLLIKLIDAREKLSVQVHPSDADAKALGMPYGKTEIWIVLDAEPGATIVWGMKQGVSAKELEGSLGSGRLCELLRTVPVKAGDVLYVPAGLLHAIGGGILLAEIQESSDSTYRVWDYDRRDRNGSLRPLHIKEALRVVRPISDREILREQFSRRVELPGRLLAATPHFAVSECKGSFTFESPDDSFLSLLVTEGSGKLISKEGELSLSFGDSIYLPAGIGSVSLLGDLTCLLSRP